MPPQQSVSTSRRQSLEAINVWVLLGTLILSVFIFIPSVSIPLTTTKAFVLAGGTLVTLAIYILARLGKGNVILPPFALVGALWLPAIAYALSSVFSGKPFMNGLWGIALEPDTLGFMLVVTMLGTLTALVLRRAEQYKAFLSVLTKAFGALVAAQILVIVVGQVSPATISPSFSLVGSLSDLASLLGLGVIGMLLAVRELEISARTRRMFLLIGIGALVLLAIANNTLVWLLIALVSLGLFIESIMQRNGKGGEADIDDVAYVGEESSVSSSNHRSLTVPLVTLAIALFFLIGGTLGNALANVLQVTEVNVRPSLQSTFAVGNQVMDTSPVFGSGPSTFGIEWLKYRDASLNSTIFWNVDFSSGIGFIPTSLVTTGIVGAFAWIAFLALLLVLGLRMLILRSPEDSYVRYVAMFSFVAAVYLFSIALFNLPNAVVLALGFVFAGLFASTMRFAARGEQWGILFSRSPRLGFVVVFSLTILLLGTIVSGYALVERFIATAELTAANSALAAGDLTSAERSVANSIAFAPTASAYQIEAAVANAMLSQIAASTTMSVSAAQSAFQSALSKGINAALTATAIAPADYRGWVALGNLYAQAVPLRVTGSYDSAKAAYDKAKELNPTNPQIHYILAQLNLANRDTKAAQEELKAAIALKQDYTLAIFLLSQLEVQDGNVRGALASALAAAYFTPNNPNILFQVGILYAAQNEFTNAAAALGAAVDANPQFANARYFLAAVYARQGNFEGALAQIKAIAAISDENASAVASQLASLEEGKNPFPTNLLTISPTTVQ